MLCVIVVSCSFEGPGCSSLGVGAFSENGPFRPKGEALIRNQFSWNRGTYLSFLNRLFPTHLYFFLLVGNFHF